VGASGSGQGEVEGPCEKGNNGASGNFLTS
jgi:hypothetical protein